MLLHRSNQFDMFISLQYLNCWASCILFGVTGILLGIFSSGSLPRPGHADQQKSLQVPDATAGTLGHTNRLDTTQRQHKLQIAAPGRKTNRDGPQFPNHRVEGRSDGPSGPDGHQGASIRCYSDGARGLDPAVRGTDHHRYTAVAPPDPLPHCSCVPTRMCC